MMDVHHVRYFSFNFNPMFQLTSWVYEAARNGRVDCVRWFIEKGVNLDQIDNKGRTPGSNPHWLFDSWWIWVWTASFNGHVDCVKVLVENGADFSIASKSGATPGTFYMIFSLEWDEFWVHIAAQEGNLDVLKFLESKGADLSARGNDGDTPRNT